MADTDDQPAERCRLYLITPPAIPDLDRFADDLDAALAAADVACVQLRLKSDDGGPAPDETLLAAARRLLPVARARDAAFILNDRWDLVAAAGADGVHLGQGDGDAAAVRARLGEDAILGVTCHASKDLAFDAAEAGADYVAFGAFFPSPTKETVHKADADLLAWWSHATVMPSVAIGGIDARNCAPLVEAGADFLAASSAVWSHPDGPGAGAAALQRAIDDVYDGRRD